MIFHEDVIGYPNGWNNFAYCKNSIICPMNLSGAAGVNLVVKPGANAAPSEKGIYSGENVLVGDNTDS